uniref:Uncharacterized protein n=1 Tax=Mus musculus TaxID=10090 RepID=Q8C9N6_MOUSE|nr:unnamed protein product [Mus musculus]
MRLTIETGCSRQLRGHRSKPRERMYKEYQAFPNKKREGTQAPGVPRRRRTHRNKIHTHLEIPSLPAGCTSLPCFRLVRPVLLGFTQPFTRPLSPHVAGEIERPIPTSHATSTKRLH